MNLSEIVDECKAIPDIFQEMKEGYSFGRYVVGDVKARLAQRMMPPRHDTNNPAYCVDVPLDDLRLRLQLYEYGFVLDGLKRGEPTWEELGFAVYLMFHPNDKKMLQNAYNTYSSIGK